MLDKSAATTREKELLESIYANLALLTAAGKDAGSQEVENNEWQATLRSSAERIGEAAFNIRKYNGKLIESEDVKQRELQSRLLFFRNAALLTRSAHWNCRWLANNFAIAASDIDACHYTLRSVASNTVYTVGEYRSRVPMDLREIQHLSEKS